MMQTSLKTKLLAAVALFGTASLAAGVATPASARDDGVHVLTIQLPTGEVEQIHYTGDVAPRVVLAAPPTVMVPAFFGGPAFAELQRLSAMMDAQAATMLRQAAEIPSINSMIPNLPHGASSYTMVATYSSNGACVRSTQVTYTGGSEEPKTVSSTSGNCGSDSGHTVPVEQIAPSQRQPRLPNTLQVNAGQKGRMQLAALDH